MGLPEFSEPWPIILSVLNPEEKVIFSFYDHSEQIHRSGMNRVTQHHWHQLDTWLKSVLKREKNTHCPALRLINFMHGNCSINQRPRKQETMGIQRCMPKSNQDWGASWWAHPPTLSSIRSAICPQMLRNCSTNQKPENSLNSAECNKNVIRPGESHNEATHQIWAQSNQRSVCKCARIQHSVTEG